MKTVVKDLQDHGVSGLMLLDTLLNHPEAIRAVLNQSPAFNSKDTKYKSVVAIAMTKLSKDTLEDFIAQLTKQSRATLFEVMDFYSEVIKEAVKEQPKTVRGKARQASMLNYLAFLLKRLDYIMKHKGLYNTNSGNSNNGTEVITRMLSVVNKGEEIYFTRTYKGIRVKSDKTVRKIIKTFILEQLNTHIAQYISYYKQTKKSQMTQVQLRREVVNVYLETILNYLKNPRSSLSVSNRQKLIGAVLTDLKATKPVISFQEIGLTAKIYTEVRVAYLNESGYLEHRYSLRLSKGLLERLLDHFSATTQRLDSTTIENKYTTDGAGIVAPKFRTITFRDFVDKGKDIPRPINRVSYTGRNLIEDGNKTKRVAIYNDCVEFDIERCGASIIGNMYADMLEIDAYTKFKFINYLKKINKEDMRHIMNCKRGDVDALAYVSTDLKEDLSGIIEFDLNAMKKYLTTIINTPIKDYREAVAKFLDKRTPASNPLYISNGVVEYPKVLFNKLSKGQLMAFVEQGYATYIVTVPQLVGYVYDAVYIKKENSIEAEKELNNNINELKLIGITFHKEVIDGI